MKKCLAAAAVSINNMLDCAELQRPLVISAALYKSQRREHFLACLVCHVNLDPRLHSAFILIVELSRHMGYCWNTVIGGDGTFFCNFQNTPPLIQCFVPGHKRSDVHVEYFKASGLHLHTQDVHVRTEKLIYYYWIRARY